MPDTFALPWLNYLKIQHTCIHMEPNGPSYSLDCYPFVTFGRNVVGAAYHAEILTYIYIN